VKYLHTKQHKKQNRENLRSRDKAAWT